MCAEANYIYIVLKKITIMLYLNTSEIFLKGWLIVFSLF